MISAFCHSATQFKFSFFQCLFSSVCRSATQNLIFSVCDLRILPLCHPNLTFSFSVSVLLCLPLCHQFKFSFFYCLFSSVCHSATNSNFHFFHCLLSSVCHQFKIKFIQCLFSAVCHSTTISIQMILIKQERIVTKLFCHTLSIRL